MYECVMLYGSKPNFSPRRTKLEGRLVGEIYFTAARNNSHLTQLLPSGMTLLTESTMYATSIEENVEDRGGVFYTAKRNLHKILYDFLQLRTLSNVLLETFVSKNSLPLDSPWLPKPTMVNPHRPRNWSLTKRALRPPWLACKRCMWP